MVGRPPIDEGGVGEETPSFHLQKPWASGPTPLWICSIGLEGRDGLPAVYGNIS